MIAAELATATFDVIPPIVRDVPAFADDRALIPLVASTRAALVAAVAPTRANAAPDPAPARPAATKSRPAATKPRVTPARPAARPARARTVAGLPKPDGTKTVRRTYRITAYCDRGTTASGVQSGVGQCAAPADIPFGSRVYIPALNKTLVVTDRTHRRFRHNTVDIFIPTEWSCLQFGVKYLECVIEIAPPRR